MARVDAPTSEAGWGCVHSLAFQRRHQCQDTDYRFKISWAVPSYQLDWMMLVATGAFWDSCWWLRVERHSFLPADWCLTRTYALTTGTSRHSACGREWSASF